MNTSQHKASGLRQLYLLLLLTWSSIKELVLPESVVGYGSLTLVLLWMICDVIIYPPSLILFTS
ncbi:hypothetical protein BDV32DRAFT_42986 [Aspergillus pseudonomiae]|nr:hypothetical protein BDV32DRAFT_42986 [Aspergillus pseudonomiae]